MNSMQPSTPPEYIATPTPLAERTNWQQPQPQQRRQPPSWKRPFQGRGSSRPRQQPADRWEEVLISPSVPIPRYVRFITARLLEAPRASAHLLLLANHAPAATRAVTVLAAVDQVLAAQGAVALLQPAVVDNSSSGSRSRGSRSGEQPSQQWQQPAGQPSGAAPWQRPPPSAAGGAREVGQDGAAVPQLRLYLRMWPRREGASPYVVAAPQEHLGEGASNAAASRAGSAAAGTSPPPAAASGEGAGSDGTGGPLPLYALGSPGRMGRTHLTSRATVPAQQAAYVLQDLLSKRGCYVAAAGGLAAANALLVLGMVRSSLLRSSSWADLVVRVDKVVPGGSRQGAAQQQQQQTTPGVNTLQQDQVQEEGAGVGGGDSSDDGQEAGADGSSSSSSTGGASSGAVVYRFTVVKAIRAHPGCRWPVPLAPVGPGWAPVRHVRAAEEAAAAAAAEQAQALKPQQRRKPWRRNKQQQQQQQQQQQP